MRAFKFALIAGLTLWGLVTLASDGTPTMTRVPAQVVNSDNLASRVACILKKHNDTLAGFWGSYTDGMRTVTYFDPQLTCGGVFFEYEIQDFSFTLVDGGSFQWPVTVDIVVFDAQTTDAPCEKPSQELCRYTVVCDSATFAFPNVGLVSFPTPCCVNGPFFMGLEYNDAGPGPFPSVAFDTQDPPDSCDNWQYFSDNSWYEWRDFWSSPGPGYPMFWVYGETDGTFCSDQEAIIYSIESLHDNYESLVGTRVSVIADYTNPDDSKMVGSIADFMNDEPMPTKSELFINGAMPDDTYNGALVVATGYLSAEDDPFPLYPDDSVTLSLYLHNADKILDAPPFPAPLDNPDQQWNNTTDRSACDPCKFAILISGGVNAANNHDRYWNNLAMLYAHKINNENYCANNIKVLYYTGTSKNTAQIPQANVDSCTQANIAAAHQDVANKIAACKAAGKQTTLQKLITNHGSPTGINLLGNNILDGGTFRGYQQTCVDSGLDYLYDEMVQCYGGNIADSMKTINTNGTTEVRVNSASGDVVHYSTATHASFLKTKIDSIAAGNTYDQSVAWAQEEYNRFLDSLTTAYDAWLANARLWLAANPPTGLPGDSVRNRVIRDSLRLSGASSGITSGQGTTEGRSNVWVRINMESYCQWKQIIVPKGGQFCLSFKGDPPHCGNVTVYKDTVFGGHVHKQKEAVWNWNNPGSAGYVAGNETRYLNGDTAQSTSFWIHNDDGEYEITAVLRTTTPDPISPSNAEEFAGWSMGGTDGSGAEFGEITTELIQMNLVNQPGFILGDMPRQLGGCGVIIVEATHMIPVITPWHATMQLRVVVSDVLGPGQLQFNISDADNPNGSFNITGPGVYEFDCGAINTPAGGTQVVQMQAGFSSCFEIDSWALRSTALDVPSGCCEVSGDADHNGAVDISDLTYTVDYMFRGGPPLPCPDEGDVDGNCALDISDLTYRVDFMFRGGPPLAECHTCPTTD